MSNLINFNYNTLSVRTVEADCQIWFVAKDVAAALEYSEDSNASRLFSSVPDEWKGVKPFHTLGGEQKMLCISEPGLYFFLGRSDKPKALPFQKWVAGEVIPSIRKTGSYSVKSEALSVERKLNAAKIILEPAGITGNQLTLALDKVYKANTGESLLAQSGVELVRPQQVHLATPSEIGKRLAAAQGIDPISGIAVNKMLAAKGYQERIDGKWVATEAGIKAGATYLDVGKARSSGTPVTQLKWPLDVLD